MGRYRLTAFPSAARTIVVAALRRLAHEGPSSLDVEVTTDEPEEALEKIAAGTADLALVHAYSNVARDLPNGITATRVGSEPVWLATRDETRQQAGVLEEPANLADYADRPWVSSPAELTCAEMVERACGRAGFRPRIVASTVDFAVQLEFVAAGLGVALVPDLTIDHVPSGVCLRPLVDPVERHIFLASRVPAQADPGALRLSAMLSDAARSVTQSRRREVL